MMGSFEYADADGENKTSALNMSRLGMNVRVLAYLVSLGIIGAGVIWIVAGTYSATSELCIAIGLLTIAVKLHKQGHQHHRCYTNDNDGAKTTSLDSRAAGSASRRRKSDTNSARLLTLSAMRSRHWEWR